VSIKRISWRPWRTNCSGLFLGNQINQLLKQACERLQATSDSPKLDAELLLAKALNKPRTYLFSWPEAVVEKESAERFLQLINQRAQGQPIAQLLGEKEFWSLLFQVNENVLTPRPDTEILVEQALSLIPKNIHWHILDLGTGSGCIAAAIAHERPSCSILAVDISAQALAVAQTNVAQLQLNNIRLMQSHWFAALAPDEPFDLIVSNPPYIPAQDPHLASAELLHEPQLALQSGQDGLDAIREIVANTRAFLKPDGKLLLEHGYDQHLLVHDLLLANGFTHIKHYPDLAGHVRVTTAAMAA